MSCSSSFFSIKTPENARVRTSGFTLIELLMVMVIGLIITAIAIPLTQNLRSQYQLNGAVSSIVGAIQATRYQAISNGYPFEIILTKATSTYQVQNDPTRTGAWGNPGVVTPISGNGTPVTLDNDVTLQFSPGGRVTASVGTTTMNLTYLGNTKRIVVSSFGNVNVQ
jgi:prepilin-type N-terminal cleavage/methylation domain-containing protein